MPKNRFIIQARAETVIHAPDKDIKFPKYDRKSILYNIYSRISGKIV